jgi:hypothetical protein
MDVWLSAPPFLSTVRKLAMFVRVSIFNYILFHILHKKRINNDFKPDVALCSLNTTITRWIRSALSLWQYVLILRIFDFKVQKSLHLQYRACSSSKNARSGLVLYWWQRLFTLGSYGDFPALLVEEDLRSPSLRYFRHERAPE